MNKYMQYSKQILAISISITLGLPAQAHLPQDHALPETTKSLYEDRVVSKVILWEVTETGEEVPRCQVDTAGQAHMVPSFMHTAHEGFLSAWDLGDLRTCSSEEEGAVAEIASIATEDFPQIAFLPAVVAAACAVSTLAGAGVAAYNAHNSTANAIDTNIRVGVGYSAFASASALTGAGVRATQMGLGVGAGAARVATSGAAALLVTSLCYGLGSLTGHYGTQYLLETPIVP